MDVSAFIISGGKSARMGKDKATLLFKGKPFIQRIINVLATLKIPIQISSNNKIHKNFNIPVVKDIIPNMGPVGAIASALSKTSTHLNIIVSCDIPLFNKEYANWLLHIHNNDYDATVVMVQQQKMPLASIYTKKCKTAFLDHLKNRQLKLLNVLDQLNINYVHCPKHLEHCVFNVNTKEDFKKLIHEM